MAIGGRWDDEQDNLLVELSKTMNSKEMASVMGRTPSAIRTRCGIIGVSLMHHEIARREENRTKYKEGKFTRVVNPLIDSETLCGVEGLRALYVPLDKIAEVICHG